MFVNHITSAFKTGRKEGAESTEVFLLLRRVKTFPKISLKSLPCLVGWTVTYCQLQWWLTNWIFVTSITYGGGGQEGKEV